MNSEFQIPNSEGTLCSGSPKSRSAFPFHHSSFVIRASTLLVVLCLSHSARACSVCFGGSDSQLSRGMLAGVLVLLLVVLSVLGGFVALFVYLARRAAATAALENTSVATESTLNS